MEHELLSSSEIKQVEANILRYFAEFCDTHGLRYCLAYGTLLGAVRHKGFIPWDDDIDVLMPRPDYEAFLSLFEKEQPSPRFKIIHYDTPGIQYSAPFAKLIDIDTEVDFTRSKDSSGWGLWVDVFPMDGAPSEEKGRKKRFRRYQTLAALHSSLTFKASAASSPLKRVVKSCLSGCLRLVGCTPVKLARKMDRYSRKISFETSEKGISLVAGSRPNSYLFASDFVHMPKLEFEGSFFYAPVEYKNFLERVYGSDYMELPPESKRITHELKAWYIHNPGEKEKNDKNENPQGDIS